jgi:hypothetical protein
MFRRMRIRSRFRDLIRSLTASSYAKATEGQDDATSALGDCRPGDLTRRSHSKRRRRDIFVVDARKNSSSSVGAAYSARIVGAQDYGTPGGVRRKHRNIRLRAKLLSATRGVERFQKVSNTVVENAIAQKLKYCPRHFARFGDLSGESCEIGNVSRA